MIFHKTIGEFDRIELSAYQDGNDWLTLTMYVGNNVKTERMVFRSTEAVRDLHYAIGRYLDLKDKEDNPR